MNVIQILARIIFCMFFHSNLYFQKCFKCDECGIFKTSEKQIKKHCAAHKKGFQICHVCSKKFEDKNHLDEHEDIHIVGCKHYKCLEKLDDKTTVCGMMYSAIGSLCAHIRDKHGKALAKSQYERKANWDITWETEDDYNIRMEAVKEQTSGFTVTDV